MGGLVQSVDYDPSSDVLRQRGERVRVKVGMLQRCLFQRFEAYMASHNHRLQPAAYLDRMGMPGGDMSSYIRRYANYLNEKRDAYKLTGYDFCKIKRG